MAKTETITLRVDPDLKKQAEALCADMGLTVSTAYTMLLKAIVRTRSIPFAIRASDRQSKQDGERDAMLAAVARASQALAGAAEEAGFDSEAELQRYAKEVIRPEVWEERYHACNA